MFSSQHAAYSFFACVPNTHTHSSISVMASGSRRVFSLAFRIRDDAHGGDRNLIDRC